MNCGRSNCLELCQRSPSVVKMPGRDCQSGSMKASAIDRVFPGPFTLQMRTEERHLQSIIPRPWKRTVGHGYRRAAVRMACSLQPDLTVPSPLFPRSNLAACSSTVAETDQATNSIVFPGYATKLAPRIPAMLPCPCGAHIAVLQNLIVAVAVQGKEWQSTKAERGREHLLSPRKSFHSLRN